MYEKLIGDIRPNTLPVETLCDLLDYDANTGKLYWKKRSARYCESMYSCARWNTRFAGMEALNTIDSWGYKRGMILGTRYKAHRAVWAIQTGKHPDGVIDHINRNKLDNRIENLRDVSHAINATNRNPQRNNTTGVPGVHWRQSKRRWVARIKCGKQEIALGSYKTQSEAIEARYAAEKEYWGI